MPKLYDKEDLAKLKDSKPVPIIAHSHEVIVPVVYSSMVNHFLEKKGVHLPLTHHELADMKREAGCSGYAKGTKDLKKKKKRKAKAKPNVIYPRGLGLAPQPPPLTRAQILYSQLRPDNYSAIRPLVQPGYVQPPVLPDYRREEEQKRKVEDDAVRRYKEEAEHRADQMKRLEEIERDLAARQAPLRKDEQQKPLHYWSEDSWAPDAYEYHTNDEERQAVFQGFVAERREARVERRQERERAAHVSELLRLAKAELARRKEEEEKYASASSASSSSASSSSASPSSASPSSASSSSASSSSASSSSASPSSASSIHRISNRVEVIPPEKPKRGRPKKTTPSS